MPEQSSAVSIVALAFFALCAFIAYRASESFRRSHGVTPWGWSSWVWGLIGFLSWVICLVLFLVAKSRTTAKLATGAMGSPGAVGSSTAYTPYSAYTGYSASPYPSSTPHPGYSGYASPAPYARGTPATPSSASSAPWSSDTAGNAATASLEWTPVSSHQDESNTGPTPAWHRDPSGRHAWRYWDGGRWTEYVSDGQDAQRDPL